MMKRILSIVLVALMLVATAAVSFSVSAAEETAVQTGANFIQFNAKGWNNVKAVYAHIWVNSGKSFYPWGASANTACENVAGTVWKYDLSKLNASTELSGGIKSGEDYLVIFHADTKVQTYDLTFGTECFGDTAKITGKMVENPVDSEKEGYEAVWTKNSSKYGPHKALTSIGNLIGSKMCPNEDVIATLGDWVVLYATTQFCDPAKALAKGLKSYGVKDITAIYAYAKVKIEKGEGGLASIADVEKCLNDAYKIAYPSETQATVNKEEAADKEAAIKDGKKPSQVATDGSGSGNNGGTSAGTGSSEPSENGGTVSGSSNSGSTNNSGSGADGENDVILFVLAGLMLLAAGAFVVTRRRED